MIKINPFKTKLPLLIALLLLILTQSGCVYLRLLEVKNQLKDFDLNFRIETGEQLIVHALDPVITDSDLLYLTKVDPSSVQTRQNRTQWTYRFEKVDEQGNPIQEDRSIVFDIGFNEKNRISQFQFHEIFLEIVPSDFIEGSLRALGNATIDKRNRKVDADSDVWSGKKLEAPYADSILAKLGPPLNDEVSEAGRLVSYKYRLQLPPNSTGKQKNRIAEVTLEFDPDTDQLKRLRTRFAGMKLSVNYQRIIEKSKQSLAAS
ncbi:MAG: hypothetical protein RBU29_09185 [bacterium]|jgi:hypothetical protein|nr:hypothetical protein [bacterium]